MPSYLLTIAYDGTPFHGWQRQDGFDTVQERLESAFATILGESTAVHGAGRTDAGVHALRQCAHVQIPKAFACNVLQRALNGNLPDAIVVRAVREVPARFHARFDAIGKRYAYRFWCSPQRPVLGLERFCWVKRPLHLDPMRRAARALLGTHDFASFATNPGYVRKRGTVRTISALRLVRRPHGIDLVIQGNGFLYNMVRTIAGTLLAVGLGKLPEAAVAEILAARDRKQAGTNCEAHGLYLVRVLYPDSALRAALGPKPRPESC